MRPRSIGSRLVHSLHGFTSGDLRPLFKTRLRVLRAEREWSHAKLADSNVSLRRVEAHFRIEANGFASS